jgi:parvulin-like peptidyl-prolyl isomerase
MKLIKEPLLHFLMIGAALFALYAWVNPESLGDDTQILVDAGRINQLQENFHRTWNRPPNSNELQELIDGFVIEEILYRQALAMGLDKDDSLIRRRLRQKMEFITADAVALYEASDDELQTYLDENPESFTRDAVYSFEQIYISTDRPSAELQSAVAEIEKSLHSGVDVPGDTSLLPQSFQQVAAFEVNRTFGSGFTRALDQAPIKQWSKPVSSDYGIHFVRLQARQPAQLPALADVRAAVEREWQNAKNQEVKAALLNDLKSGYRIVIESTPQAQQKGNI